MTYIYVLYRSIHQPFIYTTDTGDVEAVERWTKDLMKFTRLTPQDLDVRVRDACRVVPHVSV